MSLIKNFLTGQIEFHVQGLPISCLNHLRIYHPTRIQINEDEITFRVSLLHSSVVKKMISNFEYQTKENLNIVRGINFLLNHSIMVLSVLLAAVVFLIADMKIYQVQIQCDDVSLVPAIQQYLDQFGVKKFMWKNKINNYNLASDLVSNFDGIAHAHVRIAGNTLLINLVSATNQTHKVKTNFYAQYDAVVKEITAYSGTALVTTGDVVRKGDLLVADAYLDSVVVTGEVTFVNGEQISRLVIWLV